MSAEIQNIEIDFNLDEHTQKDVLLLQKCSNYKNIKVPELTERIN